MQTNTGLNDSKNNSEDVETAEVVRGDDALRALGASNVVGVKIDVEGHEPEFIRGLEAVLQRNHPIVFWEAFESTTAAQSADLLKTFGYRCFYHLGQQYIRSNLIRSIKKLSRSSVDFCSLQNAKHFTGLNVASV
jgi:hypothetical protein